MANGKQGDPLLGRWNVPGGSWDISDGPTGYTIVERGALGQTGSGSVWIVGDRVTIDMSNVLLGRVVYDFWLDRNSDRMSGSILGMPIVAQRSSGPIGGPAASRTCGSCYGSGKRICPACSGRKTMWPIGSSAPTTCMVCDFGGKVRCDFCHGTGKA
jgi:hypothetical protein